MTTRTTLIALALASCAGFAHADYTFSNVSANWLDWSSNTQDRTNKGPFGGKADFAYLEAEGGMGGNWGDVYGFLDIENPDQNTRARWPEPSLRFQSGSPRECGPDRQPAGTGLRPRVRLP